MKITVSYVEVVEVEVEAPDNLVKKGLRNPSHFTHNAAMLEDAVQSAIVKAGISPGSVYIVKMETPDHQLVYTTN